MGFLINNYYTVQLYWISPINFIHPLTYLRTYTLYIKSNWLQQVSQFSSIALLVRNSGIETGV